MSGRFGEKRRAAEEKRIVTEAYAQILRLSDRSELPSSAVTGEVVTLLVKVGITDAMESPIRVERKLRR